MLAIALALTLPLLGQSPPRPVYGRLVFTTVELKKGPSSAFDQYVRAQGLAMQDCYERELRRNPSLRGMATIELDVVKGGVAAAPKVTQDLDSNVFAACVVALVRTWRFPFEPTEEIPARISFKLEPREPDAVDEAIAGELVAVVHSDAIVRGQLEIKTIELNGKPDDVLSRFVRARARAPQGCYEKELARSPTLKGTVTVTATIGVNGRMEGISVADDLANDAVTLCVKTIVRGWAFPAKLAEPAPFKFVFTVQPNK
jgi:hypothetical protein